MPSTRTDAALLAVIRAAFPNAVQLHPCTEGCGWEVAEVNGHPAACLPCTCQGIGLGVTENAQRIVARQTIKAWLARPVDAPPPTYSYKRWREIVRGSR